MKTTIPSEHVEQVTFVNWFRKTYPLVRIYAVPNGGFRDINTAKKLKAEGAEPGVPDLHIPEWRCWIEMKRQVGGRLSDDQKEWRDYLEGIGDAWILAKGWEDAVNKLQEITLPAL